jgi:hypothetical protein
LAPRPNKEFISTLWQALRHSSSSSISTTAVGVVVGIAVPTIEGVAVSLKTGAVPDATVAVARNTGVRDTLAVAAIGIDV